MAKRSIIRKNLQLIFTIGSVFFGLIVGFALRTVKLEPKTIDVIGFPGEILMNMLKMAIVPLIAASLVTGLAQTDIRTSGRIGAYSFMFYIISMSLAVATGMVLVLIIHPGDPSIKQQDTLESKVAANVSAGEKVMDLIRNMFPENIVQATFQQVETEYVVKAYKQPLTNATLTRLKLEYRHVYGMNVMGLIVFFIGMGGVMSYLGERVRPLTDVFISLDLIITAIVRLIMWYAPIGIASLIAAKVLEINDLRRTAKMLGIYMATVILGLSIQMFITLPVLLFVATRRNPYIFMKGLTQAAITAIGTASSAATLPVSFRCLEQNNGVDPKFTKFVLPVGSIVNMDGTALYEAVASVFIAQVNGIEMDIGTVLTISITATLAAVGAASIPSAGLVTMLIVLTSVGLPINDITLIISVDWFLDRLRTMVNVIGDGFGCGFVEAMVEREHKHKINPAKKDNCIELKLDLGEVPNAESNRINNIGINGDKNL